VADIAPQSQARLLQRVRPRERHAEEVIIIGRVIWAAKRL